MGPVLSQQHPQEQQYEPQQQDQQLEVEVRAQQEEVVAPWNHVSTQTEWSCQCMPPMHLAMTMPHAQTPTHAHAHAHAHAHTRAPPPAYYNSGNAAASSSSGMDDVQPSHMEGREVKEGESPNSDALMQADQPLSEVDEAMQRAFHGSQHDENAQQRTIVGPNGAASSVRAQSKSKRRRSVSARRRQQQRQQQNDGGSSSAPPTAQTPRSQAAAGARNRKQKPQLPSPTQRREVSYIIFKSLDDIDLGISADQSIWATQPHLESRVNALFDCSKHLYAFFSANGSGRFAGYARVMSGVGRDPSLRDTEWLRADGTSSWGNVFRVQWMSRTMHQGRLVEAIVPFSEIPRNWSNPLNENKPLKQSRDGTEVPRQLGDALRAMFDAKLQQAIKGGPIPVAPARQGRSRHRNQHLVQHQQTAKVAPDESSQNHAASNAPCSSSSSTPVQPRASPRSSPQPQKPTEQIHHATSSFTARTQMDDAHNDSGSIDGDDEKQQQHDDASVSTVDHANAAASSSKAQQAVSSSSMS